MSDQPLADDGIHAERTSGAARRKAKKARQARADRAAADRAASDRPRPDRRRPRTGDQISRQEGRSDHRFGGEGEGDGRPPDARRVAVEALVRIEDGGAYANLALGPLLDRSGLEARDRSLVTELVYGTTRMRRACDWLVDRFVTGSRPLDARTRSALRLGAYQLVVLGQPPHAAVTTAVSAAPKRSRGLVNAVLRKVAAEHEGDGATFPDDATRLSYPDWIIERLTADLGADRARSALQTMNEAASATVRADGYTQDEASQWVAELVGAQPGERVLDLCAAPGGKATALAGTGAHVVAADVRPARVGLVAGNARRTGTSELVHPVVADGRHGPFAPASFDRVLVDAPCSGLGVLHRRADARWRMVPESVERLARIQVELVRSAADLVRPGGLLVVSVCTLTARETTGVDSVVADVRPDLEPLPPPGDPWVPWGRGALLLPQAAGTDGMALHRYRVPT
jgi:16S rRNA (cytosine967-C5)-methyltransferase